MTLSYKQRPNIAQGARFYCFIDYVYVNVLFFARTGIALDTGHFQTRHFLIPQVQLPGVLTATVVVTFAVVDVVNNPNVEFLTESKPNSAPRKTHGSFFCKSEAQFPSFSILRSTLLLFRLL